MLFARKTRFVIAALATLSLGACGKGDKGDKDKASAGGGGDKGTKEAPVLAAAALAWLKVDKLGVTLELPGDAKAEPGAGDSFMINSNSAPDCTVMLGKESPDMMDSYEKTLAQIKEGKMGNGKLKTVKKEEKGADGGHKIEWEAESSMDPARTLYGVDYRVMIDGAAYGCARKTDSAAGAKCVANACGTLKKL